MKKNKKLLMSFLAVNAIISSYTGAAPAASIKYDKMFDTMAKNIEKGKSNEENYKLIEKVLNKRNKELKDLYAQSDYIVKPEYLEWQIFFSGFYDERSRGDNTFESAEYHSDPAYNQQGYYDANGNYVVTDQGQGKPYAKPQEPKEINLGVSIPVKGMTREILNLSVTPAQEINISPRTLNVTPPSGITVPSVSPVSFQPVQPTINLPSLAAIPVITVGGAGGGNSAYTGFYPTGDPNYNSIISQMDLTGGSIEAITTAAGNYSYTLTNLTGQVAAGTTLTGSAIPGGTYTGAVMGTQAILKTIDNAVSRYGADITLGGGAAAPGYLEQILHYDEHYIDTLQWKTIDQLVASGYISATEGNEFASKYLDTSIGDTRTNKYLQYTVNTGQWNLKGNSVLAMNIQSHGASSIGWTANNAFENKGTIIGLNEAVNGVLPQKQIAFMFTEGENAYRYQVVDNTGLVEMRAPQSVGYSLYNVYTSLDGKYVMMNNNDIKLYGQNNVGIYTKGQMSGPVRNTQIKLFSPITVLGDESIGIDIERQLDFANSKIKVDVGTEDPRQTATSGTGVSGLENSGALNTTGYSNVFTDNGVGIYVNMAAAPGAFTLTDYELNIGSFSQGSIGLRVENGNITLGSNMMDTTTKHSIVSDGGIGNILVAGVSGSSIITIGSDTVLEAKNGKSQVGLYANMGSTITNNGTLTASGEGTKGIVVDTGSTMTNTGNISVTGGVYTDSLSNKTGSVGVAVKGAGSTFTSTSGSVVVDVSGKESTGLFADTGTINITNGNIKTADGAFNLYSKGSTGKITLTNSTLETGQKSLLFYNETGGTFNLTNVNATVRGGTNVVDRGTAFYYVGTGILPALTTTDLSSYFTTVFNGTAGNLTLNMDSGSRLFIVDNVSIDLSVTATPLGSIPGGPTVNGSNYKTYMMYKSLLGIDQAVNLDSASDAYNVLEIATSSISNNGQTINGTIAGQAAIAQENGLTPGGVALPRSTVTLTNNGGTISLSGVNSVGMYTSNGEIYNTTAGKINATGDNSIGIYATNGTKVDTAAGTEINIGKNGVGIYAEGWKQGTAQLFGNGELDIKNSGLIKSGTGTAAIGVYLNNNSGVAVANSKLDLSTGTIDVSSSDGGIGVYVDKGTVTDAASIITVGKNGIGLYAKDSNVTLTGSTVNLNGDNALGVYLDGTTSFTGAGTINIAGQNIVLFNMASSGTVTNNFNVGTVAAGSSYSLGNIVNGAFTYTGTTSLGSNGTLMSGQNSAVYLNGSTITANPGATGVAAIALDGQYAGTVPVGMTLNTDGENNGIIALGDGSAGMYGKNGTRLSNLGTVTAGNASAGIMTSGAGSLAINNGGIALGAGSQGIYLKDGADIQNNASGSITSSGAGTVGMYADNVSNPIVNGGTIQLLGDKSIGIYTKGASIKTINNTGTVEVGNSSNMNDSSIGIFSENIGDTINNTGTVTSGINSIGIYSVGGTVNQNGISNIGDTGVGIYSTNGTVNIAPTSVFNFGTNGAVGVYGTNSTVANAAAMNVGNGNYGFILTDGIFTNSAANITLGSDSVFVYRSGAGMVTNGAGTTLTMTGSDNVGYYTVNGGTVTNDGVITGIAGKNNVGIYNTGGSITNTGIVNIGDSDLVLVTNSKGEVSVDVASSKYAVGLYGENSTVANTATGSINVGAGGIGITTKGGTGTNNGTITGAGDYTRGMYTEGGTITNNGTITVTGNDVMGMAGNGAGSNVVNNGTITVSGDRAIGMFGNSGTVITNAGTIMATGTDTLGIVLSQGSTLNNAVSGTMIVNGITSGNYPSTVGTVYPTPTIINSGVIKVSEKFETNGIDVVIKVDPSTVTVPTASQISAVGYDPIAAGASYLISNSVHIEAPAFNITAPLQVTGNFAEGTNVKKYKLEDVIKPGSGYGINAGVVPVVSKSLTWRATPVMNSSGNVDFWMEKIDYNDFTDGLWYADFGRALDDKYENAQGDAMKIYDKLDIIENEGDFRHIMAGLAGEVYANINQREDDIAKTFENSLDFIENSKNNTKENVKVNIIAGKGKNSEKTDGVVGYDYSTAGVLGLREVERTYRHTFGYSLGYLHTGFEFNDGNDSEEWVDTIQLGVHSKYSMNDWKLRNDLTGRISFHNVDRNIDWTAPNGRSEMNGMFETYSITSDNILGREFTLGKNTSITPYGAVRAMYVTRPTFNETGLEALEVEGNDAWSVKPRAGIELKAALPLGPRTAWQLKGTLDFAYEYELADLNEREKARLIAVEDGYHDLSKPEDEKGTFRTRASLGAEVEDRYGIFLTGEYGIGNSDQDDYRAGVTLKAVF